MKHKRHAVVCVPLPPGFVRSSPDQIPADYLAAPRVSLGEAAALAAKLNAEQIAAGDRERKLFLPVKAFEGMRAAAGRRRHHSSQTTNDQSNSERAAT